jgi:hypothetical protein
MIRTLLTILLALSVSACASPPHFLKPNTSRDDFDRDYDACIAATRPSIGRTVGTMAAALFVSPVAQGLIEQRKHQTTQCMQTLGYDVSPGNDGYQGTGAYR